MKLLLDTHLLLWTAIQSARLSTIAHALIEDEENTILYSVASLWEVAIKTSRGRDDFRVDPHLLRRNLIDGGFQELAVTGQHAAAVVTLPWIHKDPFDRLLVAQAIEEGILLLTVDATLVRYPAPVRLV